MRGQFQDQGGFFSYIGADSGGSSANEHFSVDGTLIEAWASHKSFQPKDGSDDGDGSNFHGQRRKNAHPAFFLSQVEPNLKATAIAGVLAEKRFWLVARPPPWESPEPGDLR